MTGSGEDAKLWNSHCTRVITVAGDSWAVDDIVVAERGMGYTPDIDGAATTATRRQYSSAASNGILPSLLSRCGELEELCMALRMARSSSSFARMLPTP